MKKDNNENAPAIQRITLRLKTLIAAELFNSHKDTDRKVQKEPLKSAKERPYINGEDLFSRKKRAFYSTD